MDAIELNNSPYAKLFFPAIVEGEKNDSGDIKYSAKFGIPNSPEAFKGIKGITDTQIDQLIKMSAKFKDKVMAAAKSEVAKGGKLSNLFKSGDEVAEQAIADFEEMNEGKPVPEYLSATSGFWLISARTNYKPQVFGPKASQGVLSDDEANAAIYSGCWARADFRGYAWNYQGKKGWSLGLGARVQKWMDDTNLGGGNAVEAPEDAMEIAVPSASSDDFID